MGVVAGSVEGHVAWKYFNPSNHIHDRNYNVFVSGTNDSYVTLRNAPSKKRVCENRFCAEVTWRVVVQPSVSNIGILFIVAALLEIRKLSDVEFVEELIKQVGVAAIPGFAFCKGDATLRFAFFELTRVDEQRMKIIEMVGAQKNVDMLGDAKDDAPCKEALNAIIVLARVVLDFSQAIHAAEKRQADLDAHIIPKRRG
ncbi:hypothetical protein CTI12_AA514400 [Artemisia annua]|uniref:Uncharacterized protein n=1 Tax=Artemisia annua TaxID=35608 RepID=A0A2U1L959_ARTAN|nr:hypothetical protein CTI12_AA514400 [Artemisia annua]